MCQIRRGQRVIKGGLVLVVFRIDRWVPKQANIMVALCAVGCSTPITGS